MMKKHGGYNIKMANLTDRTQPLRLPSEMVEKVEKVSNQLNVSKNDVYKMAIALFISKFNTEFKC